MLNIVGQGLGVGLQVLSVPLMISNWGLESFGGWVAFNALFSYVTFFDLGTTQMLTGEYIKNEDETTRNDVLNRAMMCFGLSVVIAVFYALIMLNMNNLANDFGYQNVSLLTIFYSLSFFIGYMLIPLRAHEKYLKYTILTTFLSGLWAVCNIASLLVLKSQESLLMTWVTEKLIEIAIIIVILVLDGYKINLFARRKKAIKLNDVLNSTAHLASLLIHTMKNQGIVLFIDLKYGQSAVGQFAVAKTIGNIIYQISVIFKSALTGLITKLYLRKENRQILKVLNNASVLYVSLSLILIVVLQAHGEGLLGLWIKSNVMYNNELLLLCVLIASICGLANILAAYNFTVNLHSTIVYFSLIVYFVIGVCIGYNIFGSALNDFLTLVLVAETLVLTIVYYMRGKAIGMLCRD